MLIPHLKDGGRGAAWVQGAEHAHLDHSPSHKPRRRTPGVAYDFEHIYGVDASNEDIYTEILEEGVGKCLDGFNFTVFCYGQTGSGTHCRLSQSAPFAPSRKPAR